MPKYKINDRVIVRSDLIPGMNYSMENGGVCNVATADMCALRGSVVTIANFCGTQYRVSGSDYCWTDEMFSGLANSLKYNIGDCVKVRDDLPEGVYPKGMRLLRGRVVTITAKDVVDAPGKAPGYSIKEDDELWVWADADFDGLVERPVPRTKKEPNHVPTKVSAPPAMARTQVPCDEAKPKTNKKEKKSMKFNFKNMLKQYMPRTIDDGSVALSISGDIAYRRTNGDYVFYDPESKSINNCMDLVVGADALDKMVFVMPVKSVSVGDVVLNGGKYIYITNITEAGAIKGISLESGRTATLVKEINTIMGCFPYSKVTSLFSMANGKGAGDFNPMLLMMLGNSDGEDDMLTTIAMMSMMGGGAMAGVPAGGMFGGMNPLMLMVLSGDDDDDRGGKSDLLQLLMMSQMMGGNGLFQSPAPVPTAPVPAVPAAPVEE